MRQSPFAPVFCYVAAANGELAEKF